MKETTIRIEFPEHYSNNEIIDCILGQLDTKLLQELGIKFYVQKDNYFGWF